MYRVAVLQEGFIKNFDRFCTESYSDAYEYGAEMCLKWKGLSFLIWSQTSAIVVKRKHFDR